MNDKTTTDMKLKRLHLPRLTGTLLVTLAALLAAQGAAAYDFMAGGICYNINSDGESVTVTYEQQPDPWDNLPAYTNTSGSLNIPSSVTKNGKAYSVCAIGEYAFSCCSGFTGSLIIPNSVATIGEYAFCGCTGFSSLTFPNSVRFVDMYAFTDFGYGIKDVYFQDGCDCVFDFGFIYGNYDEPGTRIHFGKDIQRLSFEYDSFTGNDTLYIEDLTSYCNNVSFSFNNGVPMYNNGTMFINGEELNGHLDIPDNAVRINQCAFYGASKMTSATIPNSIQEIGDYALAYTGLRDIYCEIEDPQTIKYGNFVAVSARRYIFEGVAVDSCTLHVPAGTEELYRTTEPWAMFFNIVEESAAPLRGDVNGDGKVDIGDVSCVVNLVLGHAVNYDFGGRDDVNEDNTTDVRDLNEIIKIIMNE